MKKLIKILEKRCTISNSTGITKFDIQKFHSICRSVNIPLTRNQTNGFRQARSSFGFCEKKKDDNDKDKKEDKKDDKKDDKNEDKKDDKTDDKGKDGKDKKDPKSDFEAMLKENFSKEEILYIKKYYIGLVVAIMMIITSFINEKVETITNIEFIELIEQEKLTKVVIKKDPNMSFHELYGHAGNQKTYMTEVMNVDTFSRHAYSAQEKKGKKLEQMLKFENGEVSFSNKSLQFIIGAGILLMFVYGLRTSKLKKGGKIINNDRNIFTGLKSQEIKDYSTAENKIDIKFDQVAGMESAKREIVEFVDFLKNPEKYTKLGAKIPKGALLVGPPGTGKTLLAKATAGEAGVPFFSMSGSEFVEMFVGVGASRVRKLFKTAKDKAPSIIFIDEIDAIGKSRSGMFQNDEKDNTLNQLLVEMDGFGTENNVIVLAATNFSESLDPALTRPGRFDRKVEVMLPDLKERQDIFNIYLKKVKLNPEKTMNDYSRRLSTLTPGFSGADISNLVNEAAIISARNNLESVGSESFEKASERVIAGMETKRPLDEKTKLIIATHESGHAIVSWMQEFSNPLVKVTIIPRSKGALGFNQFMSDDKNLHSKEYLLEEISTLLGGRVAEEIILGGITTGASNDLERVTKLAHSMVTLFGMSDLGLQAYKKEGYIKPFSSNLEEQIDVQVNKIIEECLEKTRKIITEKKDLLQKLSSKLIEKETLDIIELINILGERPYPLPETVTHYLKEVQERELEKEKEQAAKSSEVIKDEEVNKNI